MAGLTPEGFEPKPLEDIKSDLDTGLRAVFGNSITTIAQSVFGQIVGIVADRLADLWQLGLSLYGASTREGASGIQLDNIGSLTGTTRRQATYSKVDCLCSGTPTTVIPAGRIISVSGSGIQFTNDLPGTISGGGTVTIEFRAVETGPKVAYAGTLTVIETPVSGWASVTNADDHKILGSDIESDAAYRLRQISELRAQGASTVAALRAKLGAVTNVIDVFVFENVSDATDGNGLPPHSFETVISGGTEDDIARVLVDTKPAGIATYGTTTVAVDDSNGFSSSVKFSRPDDLEAYITVNATVDQSKFPSNGSDLIKQALADSEVNYHIGSELRSSALIPVIFAATTGVLECELPLIGLSASPSTSTTVSANNRQKFAFDTSRIVLNLVYTLPS